jgi:hypothetical protein
MTLATMQSTEPTQQVPRGYEFVDGELTVDTGAAERRRGLRVRQARPIKVFEAAGARYFGGQTEDISATGLRIELPASADMRPGEVLNIHVGLNRGGSMLANRRQMIPARVVWVDRTGGSSLGYLVVGVEFLANISARSDAA